MSNRCKDHEIIGKRYHRWLVISRAGRDIKNNILWLCQCDCGTLYKMTTSQVNAQKTKSCGCIVRESGNPKNSTHYMTGTRFYRIWAGIKKRCYNPKEQNYVLYGGKGITACEHWLTFENFRDDMYDSYLKHVELHGEKNTSIERKNSDKNYCLENCRWATPIEQANNISTNRWFEAISPSNEIIVDKNYTAFARNNSLDYRNVCAVLNNKRRIHKGWTFRYLTEDEIKLIGAK